MRFIKLRDHIYAMVDDEDYERVSQYKYRAEKVGNHIYANRRYQRNYVVYNTFLHYDVLGISHDDIKPLVVDHKNRNPLDCRKGNLRICTRAENCHNSRPMKGKSSKYKGVIFRPGYGNYRRKKPWHVVMQKEGKRHSFGYYATEFEAYKKANVEAYRLYGPFAYLNNWTGPTRLCKNCGVFEKDDEEKR